MKKILVLFSVFVMVLAGSLGFSTNAKALSILDPGVSAHGCCSKLEWNDYLGWVMVVPCVEFGGQYYSLTLQYNPQTDGFEIYSVGQGDGSCVSSGGGTACSDCSCPTYASAHPSECGATGALNFRLTWRDQNDVDLHVTYAGSEHIYYANTQGSTTGGKLDVDSYAGCRTEHPSGVENIFYDAPPDGIYVLKICGYKHCDGQPASTTVRAQVLAAGGGVIFDQNIPISTWSGNSNCLDRVVTIQVDGGQIYQVMLD